VHRLLQPMAKPLDSLYLVGTLHDAISADAVPLASVSGGARVTPWLRVKSAQHRIRDLALQAYAAYEQTANEGASYLNRTFRMLPCAASGRSTATPLVARQS
jgi:hypothetical protein